MNNSSSSQIHVGLNHQLAAGRSLIMVQTYEEDRLERLLSVLAEERRQALWIWRSTTGITTPEGPVSQTREPDRALDYLLTIEDNPLVWFCDLHHHYTAPVVRGLRDLSYRWGDGCGVVVVSATRRAIPEDLEREMAYLLLDLPDAEEMAQVVEEQLPAIGTEIDIPINVITASLKGLTLSEAKHALTRVKNQKPEASRILRILQEEKRQLISKTGTLEFIPEVPEIKDLGGLENLKDWLLKRRELLVTTDEALREITPKGILLMGVSGCGKSLCIKAISSAWQLPLYRLEMIKIFSGAHGGPEHAFSTACHLMEEMAPAVLWIDEIEMGLSGEGSAAADSVLSRIFAFFLTWMQEKPPGLFVAATANRIDLLPAEMIRKGRFDQVFFVDLPTVAEREQIFRIHLKKRGYDPKLFTTDVFSDATEGWSGAEIEQCVIAAVTSARMEHRDLVLKDMYTARKQIVPISTTMEEQVRHIRNWAYDRAIRASAEE